MSDRQEGSRAATAAAGRRPGAANGRTQSPSPPDTELAPVDARWRSLAENTPAYILIVDRQHRIRFINHPQRGETHGEVAGRTPYDYCLREHHDTVRKAIEQVFSTGEPVTYEVEAHHPHAGNVWYLAHLGPIFESGQVMAVSMVALEITAQKRAERERDRALAILNATIECLPFDFFALGPDSRYMLMNAVARRHYPDGIGKMPQEICPNEHDLAHWLENNRRAFAGERVEGEVEATIGRRTYYFYNVLAPIRDGDQSYGILGVNVDISDRVRVEKDLRESERRLEQRVNERTAELTRANEELQRSEERYRSLLEACPDAVAMSDLEGRLLFASRRAAELIGAADVESFLGRNVFDFVIERDRQRLAANLADVIQAGLRRNRTYTLLRQDGTTVPVEVSSAVIRHPDGKPKAVMAILRDVSERHRAEAALERERRTLVHMVRAGDHERQTIAYDIHDGPAQQLAAAIMQLQSYDALKDSEPATAETAFKAGVQLVQRAHGETRRLISGVRPPILDESGVAAAIAHLVYEHAATAEARLDFHTGVTIGRLAGVLENSLYRIAQEALANAVQHSHSENIRVSLCQQDNALCLEVQDWGVGFVAESLDESHFGLEGIKERTRLLGGECAIQSKPGEGTCVRVTLPVLERQQDTAAPRCPGHMGD